jgi:GNAT superfamily N-acetyltransferase
MQIDVSVTSEISRSPRARQLEGMFDIPPQDRQALNWKGEAPLADRDWNIGLIVGPSGCGKTILAHQMFGAFDPALEWKALSVIDDFPPEIKIADIAAICQSVGFNTIPAWLRPYAVLSNGEKFRVEIARRIIESAELIVVDEFTSVVDRGVAKIGSHAIAKTMRKTRKQFVAVSCHYDIVEWLNPDWVLEPATMTFQWRELRRRPAIDVEIAKVRHEVWRTFAPFHYMTAHLHKGAHCYCLFIDDVPAAFAGMMKRPHPKADDIWGLSRVVTLPDYQGLGLAFVLMDTLAKAFAAVGQRFHTYPAHPALIRNFDASPNWMLHKAPGYPTIPSLSLVGFGRRPCAVFEWCGGKMEDRARARDLLAIRQLT